MHLAFLIVVAGAAAATVVLYASLVLDTYRSEGRNFRLRVLWRDPARSGLYFLVWLGLHFLDVLLRLARQSMDTLTEASAEVGEWYLRRRDRAT
jgi:hypothetical protein